MLTIRLARGGAKKRPFYHIVVAEKTSPRDGRFVERLGFSNPQASGNAQPINISMERFEHWTKAGAKPSPTVSRLVRQAKRATQSNA
ncbi:30S ribosomal protein S16 [Candidatus Persebacteraceae bacterium Df01]|uniref:Small ribosomal subunit protein bS16 n=1 Tax=Candidatus Doriopsillibacter californiensis TaxID=2970740 RepID=A0ABT7QLJ0_9GAMM|nr:30S ribosomal protein S16 [Candidatus Persebacteraceae bacterium Df01]